MLVITIPILIICALKWLMHYLTVGALMYYMETRKIKIPEMAELNMYRKEVAQNAINDLFNNK